MSDGDPPVFPGVLYGLRRWKLSGPPRRRTLSAAFVDRPWPAGRKAYRATCNGSNDHSAPDPECGCGIYAFHANDRGLAGLRSLGTGEVIGLIEAWGNVELHADGFRAEHARIRLLLLTRGADERKLRELAARHGADVFAGTLEDLLAHARAQGLAMDERTVDALLAPRLEVERAERRSALRRARAAAVAWSAADLAVVATVGWQLVEHWPQFAIDPTGTAPAAPVTDRALHVVRTDVITYDDETAALAVIVRNDSRERTALGVYAEGEISARDGTVVAIPDDRLDQEVRPSLAPGQTGVLYDDISDADGDEDAARTYRVTVHARTYRLLAERAPMEVGRASVDRDTCLLSAPVLSDRTRLESEVAVVARTPSGRIAELWGETVGPLRRGGQRQAVTRLPPRTCLSRTRRLEVYARPSYAQLSARSRRGVRRRAVSR